MKTRNFIKSIVTSVLLLLTMFTACKKETEPAPQPLTPPFVSTMKVGDESIFDITGNFGGGNAHYNNAVTIKTIKDLGGNNYYMTTNIPMFNVADTMTVYIDNRGAWDKQKNGQMRLLGSSNPMKGAVTYAVTGSDTTFTKVVDINMSVTVPAGTFSCTEIKEFYSNSSDYRISYTSKGLVKMQQYGSMPITFELRSRNFN